MELLKLTLFFLLLFSCTKVPSPINDPLSIELDSVNKIHPSHSHTLYLAQKGEIQKALLKYLADYPEEDTQNYTLLQQLAVLIVNKGYQSSKPEEVLLALYGAGVSQHSELFYVLEGCLRNPYPNIQLAALNYIGQSADYRGRNELNAAMSSPYLPVRLEAAYWLALTKAPTTTGQLESLMNKLPKETHPYFPQLFALTNTSSSIDLLRQFILQEDPALCSQAIIQASEAQIEELLPSIHSVSKHLNPLQQEACAFAFGVFNDSDALPILEKYLQSPIESLQLNASVSLVRLGKKEALNKVLALARAGNIFAIAALGDFPQGREVLYTLAQDSNPQISFNATLSLLKLKDPYCLKKLENFLLPVRETPLVTPRYNPTKTLTAYQLGSSARSQQEFEFHLSLTTQFRERLLIATRELPLDSFYQLCEKILDTQQQDLIPTAIHLLENLETEEASALLIKGRHTLGNPLIRTYCTLALFRMNEQSYEEKELLQWIDKEDQESLITFRQMIPWQHTPEKTPYELTPKEKSRLLIESFQTLAEKQHPHTIHTLISIMAKGHPSNCYALAGLLIRATE